MECNAINAPLIFYREIATGRLLTTLQPARAGLPYLFFSGDLFISVPQQGTEKTIEIWDMATRKSRKITIPHLKPEVNPLCLNWPT